MMAVTRSLTAVVDREVEEPVDELGFVDGSPFRAVHPVVANVSVTNAATTA
jgi:hypothetical protein